MNTMRKVQITAAAVIANGLGVLAVTTPNTAEAVTCGSQSMCYDFFCPANAAIGCSVFAPEGCQVRFAGCSLDPTCIGKSSYKMYCSYKAI